MMVSTKGWERSDSTSFGYGALDAIYDRFRASLENPSVNLSAVREEWDDMVDYSKKYPNIVQLYYKVIWWKIYNAVDDPTSSFINTVPPDLDLTSPSLILFIKTQIPPF